MFRTGRADDGIAGVKGASRPGSGPAASRRLSGARHELDRRIEPRAHVVVAADSTEEQADDLVPDDLVDQAVVVEDRLRPQVGRTCPGSH
jgi:hypothetical protein